jgi:3-oxosteroid 1-dehydrogenase
VRQIACLGQIDVSTVKGKLVAWDEEFDVVCVGSGGGGLTAAATAAASGAKVLIAEKDQKIGGVTGRSGGQVWVGATELAEHAGMPDSVDEVVQYLDNLSDGLAVPHLRESYVHKSIEAVRYLSDTLNIPLNVIAGLPDYYYPNVPGSKSEGRYLEIEPFDARRLGSWSDRTVVSPFSAGYSFVTTKDNLEAMMGIGDPIEARISRHVAKDERCAGAGLSAHILSAGLERGVVVRAETRAISLVNGAGGVEGLILDTPTGQLRVRAHQGVLLATGGYDWNKDFVRSFEGIPESASMCPPTIEGDHLVMAAELGAMPTAARTPAHTPIFVGYHVPGDEADGHPAHRAMWIGCLPHAIYVNRKGLRFADDSFYPDVVAAVSRFDGTRSGQPNWPAWLIFDENYRNKYGLDPIEPGKPLPDGLAHTADTIQGLANNAGIDSIGLEATIERFNDFCELGTDKDFDRGGMLYGRMSGDPRMNPNPNLGPICDPPFYAVPLQRITLGVPTVGLPINEKAQVIDATGSAIPGLYAAGNSASWQEIGGGFNSGIANARGIVFGYLAAKDMLL